MSESVSHLELTIRAACVVFVAGVLLLSCGEPVDRSAERDTKTIQENVKRINEENSPQSPKPDPEMEKTCREVSQKQMDDVEAKVKAGEMLLGDDMKALRCSRYQMWLRGEISSY